MNLKRINFNFYNISNTFDDLLDKIVRMSFMKTKIFIKIIISLSKSHLLI